MNNRRAELAVILVDAVDRCGAVGVSASLTIEVTGDEIVDVRIEAEPAALATCVEERVWIERLGAAWNADTTVTASLP